MRYQEVNPTNGFTALGLDLYVVGEVVLTYVKIIQKLMVNLKSSAD